MRHRPFCVGLTGGVGCGKSTVAELFARLGADVIDADAISHELTAPNGAAMAAIVDTFGGEFATQAGALDRTAMRTLVFSDPAARKKLQAILHPLIRAEVVRRLESLRVSNARSYALLMVPLLVENLAAYQPLLDRVVVVDCDESQQLARTAARPGLNVDQAKAILAAQTSNQSRIAIADDLIDNSGELGGLDMQVRRLHALYLKQAIHSLNST
ncbi:MAG: dephospho-CoA kinase [Hydrogenophilales bacterium 28-61-23]|nr:MAG: dephospho-CoA kinase [Hydrogenophilales bacterium 28-61-23]